jgi:hypothetical protein
MTSPAKIHFSHGANVRVEFASASELRDALLASYPDAAYFNGPFVGTGRDDTLPAWGWAANLLRTRTDWWPALGIALQHAAHDGGELARTALADLLEGTHHSVVLLEWTEPLAKRWPDVRATTTATSFGRPDYRLETIVAAQKTYWTRHCQPSQSAQQVVIEGLGAKGGYLTTDLKDAGDLEALLRKSAAAGKFPSGDKGPWSWLLDELVFHAWLRTAMPQVCAHLASGSDADVRAMLDWFSEEWDLWRFIDLLDGWRNRTPAWWHEPAAKKPAGWRYTMRTAHWPGVKTLGDIALEALRRAQHQAATPPRLDIAPRP